MSLRGEIFNIIYRDGDGNDFAESCTGLILEKIQMRIDSMIGIDNQTINRKRGTYEGRIAAQASKNALILVKEMLK